MTRTDRAIGRGERAPDFALPRHGTPTRFYGVVGGAPAVLLFTGAAEPGGASDRPVDVIELAGKLRSNSDDRVTVHVISRDPAAGGAEFVDQDGRVHDAYGLADVAEPVAVVLDHNVRVAGVHPLDELADPLVELPTMLPRPLPDLGTAPRTAPVLFVPDALEPGWCERLIGVWETEGAVQTGVETVVEGELAEATDVRFKRRRDHTVTDRTLLRELTRHIGRRVIPEVNKAFAFQAGGFEGFKICCYDAQDAGFFQAHRDNLSSGTAHRHFALTLNLNDGYEGGELRFPEYGATRYRPAAGEALIFSGAHLHEVLPVTGGRRFVLLSFLLARGARRA